MRTRLADIGMQSRGHKKKHWGNLLFTLAVTHAAVGIWNILVLSRVRSIRTTASVEEIAQIVAYMNLNIRHAKTGRMTMGAASTVILVTKSILAHMHATA